MRVLHLATSFPSGPDCFAGSFIHRLVRAEVASGVCCTVLTPAADRPSNWPDEYPVHRFRYAPMGLQKLAQQPGGIPAALGRTPLSYGLLAPFLAAMLTTLIGRAKQHDIIHAHWAVCGAMAVLTRHLHKRPVITTLRGSDFHFSRGGNGVHGWLLDQAVTGSAAITAVSDAIAAELKKKIPDKKDFVYAIANGIAEEFFRVSRKKGRGGTPLKILFVGSLVSLKGVKLLFEALARSHASPWACSVAGDGPERRKLAHIAGRLGISDRVAFVGSVPPGKVAALMADHDILVLPSYREGRPNVVLEAMASGMAVVASDIDGCRELVRHDRTGWLFPAGDVEGLRCLLHAIFRGEKDIAGTGLAARKWLETQGLSWEKTAARYRALYDKVLGG